MRIATAARRMLDKEGTEAVTMRPVALAIGVTPMAIYRHYPDRVSLLNALADEGFEELAVRVAGKKFSDNIEERLTKMMESYLDHALEKPRLFELMFLKPREGARSYPLDFKAGRSPTGLDNSQHVKETCVKVEAQEDPECAPRHSVGWRTEHSGGHWERIQCDWNAAAMIVNRQLSNKLYTEVPLDSFLADTWFIRHENIVSIPLDDSRLSREWLTRAIALIEEAAEILNGQTDICHASFMTAETFARSQNLSKAKLFAESRPSQWGIEEFEIDPDMRWQGVAAEIKSPALYASIFLGIPWRAKVYDSERQIMTRTVDCLRVDLHFVKRPQIQVRTSCWSLLCPGNDYDILLIYLWNKHRLTLAENALNKTHAVLSSDGFLDIAKSDKALPVSAENYENSSMSMLILQDELLPPFSGNKEISELNSPAFGRFVAKLEKGLAEKATWLLPNLRQQ